MQMQMHGRGALHYSTANFVEACAKPRNTLHCQLGRAQKSEVVGKIYTVRACVYFLQDEPHSHSSFLSSPFRLF